VSEMRPAEMNDFGSEAVAVPEASADRDERIRKLFQLLAGWMADEAGHDEKVWPKLKAVPEQNRFSSLPLFREDSD
jgi:hypothetical protein